MKTVDISYVVEPSYDEIIQHLSPEDIIAYADFYEIESCEQGGETETITVLFEDEILVFEFAEIENGYEYTLVESSGLFAERYSRIQVLEDDMTEVVAETEFTLDTRWSFILDWIVSSTVRQELEIVVEALIAEVVEAE